MTTVIGDGDLYYFKQGVWRAVGQFLPYDIAPSLWLDASDTATITSSGTPAKVSQWDDKSGNGNHFVQATAALQPTTGATTVNGLNAFDFTNHELGNASFSLADPCVVFFVFERVGTGTQVMYDSFGGGRLISYWASNAWRYFQGTIITGANDSGLSVFTTVHDQANSFMNINGSQVASGNPGTQDNAATKIGRNLVNGQPIVGTLCEFIVADRILTTEEIAKTETYLAAKWGI